MLYQPPTGGAANDPYIGANPGLGVVGSKIPPKAVEHHQRELIALITNAGLTPSEADLTQVSKAVQSGKMNYAVATGTANAWVVAPSLALAAYAAGRVLWVRAPATNTATTVTANVSTLGTRPVKKSDGTDPAIGDLVIGRWYPTIDDGTNVCVVSPLPSDVTAGLSAAVKPPLANYFELTTTNTQVVGNTTITVVTDFAITASKPSDATFATGSTITLGPNSAGVWAFSQLYVPSQVGGVTTVTQAYLQKNGVSYQNQTVSGTFCSNSGVIRVANGDTLRMAIYQNSGTNQKNQHAPALPVTTVMNLYQISS